MYGATKKTLFHYGNLCIYVVNSLFPSLATSSVNVPALRAVVSERAHEGDVISVDCGFFATVATSFRDWPDVLIKLLLYIRRFPYP